MANRRVRLFRRSVEVQAHNMYNIWHFLLKKIVQGCDMANFVLMGIMINFAVKV